jgi:membrane protein
MAAAVFMPPVYGIARAFVTRRRRFRVVSVGNAARAVEARWRSFKKIVLLWVDLFDRHNLLTYASAIALRMFIAAVACTLFALGILGASGQQQLWRQTIGPAIEPKVLPDVFAGIDQTVNVVFSSSTAGLLALASALAVWEVSGIVRAGIGALDEIYETKEPRPFWIRFPLSFGLAILFLAAMLGAIAIVWAGHVSGNWSIPILILRWPAAVVLVAFAFELIVRWAPAEHRRARWASLGSALVVIGWIGETLIFAAYVRSVANFRTPVGSLEVFIFLATYFYVAAIVLLVAMELDELVRLDMQRPRKQQELLPLVAGVIRGG